MRISKKTGAPLLRLTLMAAALVFANGCLNIFDQEFVDPKFDLRGESVLLVEFKTEDRWYGESEEGHRLYMELYRQINQVQEDCSDVDLVLDPAAQKAIAQCLDDNPPWDEFGQQAEADYILLGSIQRLDIRRANVVGMYEGTMQLRVQIFDVAGNDFVYSEPLFVRFPKDMESNMGAMNASANERLVRLGLFAEASKKICKEICGYIRSKNMPEDSGLP